MIKIVLRRLALLLFLLLIELCRAETEITLPSTHEYFYQSQADVTYIELNQPPIRALLDADYALIEEKGVVSRADRIARMNESDAKADQLNLKNAKWEHRLIAQLPLSHKNKWQLLDLQFNATDDEFYFILFAGGERHGEELETYQYGSLYEYRYLINEDRGTLYLIAHNQPLYVSYDLIDQTGIDHDGFIYRLYDNSHFFPIYRYKLGSEKTSIPHNYFFTNRNLTNYYALTDEDPYSWLLVSDDHVSFHQPFDEVKMIDFGGKVESREDCRWDASGLEAYCRTEWNQLWNYDLVSKTLQSITRGEKVDGFAVTDLQLNYFATLFYLEENHLYIAYKPLTELPE